MRMVYQRCRPYQFPENGHNLNISWLTLHIVTIYSLLFTYRNKVIPMYTKKQIIHYQHMY
jgi:hypothetical protein